jgi:hypothetical protein
MSKTRDSGAAHASTNCGLRKETDKQSKSVKAISPCFSLCGCLAGQPHFLPQAGQTAGHCGSGPAVHFHHGLDILQRPSKVAKKNNSRARSNTCTILDTIQWIKGSADIGAVAAQQFA